MKTKLLALLFLLATAQLALQAQETSSAGSTGQFSSQDAKISAIYVDQASAALAKGDWNTVSALLRVALEFDPTSSDALYLQGEMYEGLGGKVSEAIASYESAADKSSWNRYTQTECLSKLAPLLIRTKQYRRALDMLHGLGDASSSYLYNYALALVGVGGDYQARRLLASAVQAYPLDTSLVSLRIRIDGNYRSLVAEQTLSGAEGTSVSQPVLAALIRFTQDPSTERALVALYDKSFPRSARVFGESLLVAPAVSKGDIDTYVADGLLSDGNLTQRLYAALAPGPTKSYLSEKIKSYSGTVTLDTNGDGIPEESAEYRDGTISRLVVDTNQDDVPEYDVGFVSGTPATVGFNADGLAYAGTYGRYPFLSTVVSTAAGQQTTYTLEPGHVSFSLFGGSSKLPGAPAAFPPLVKPQTEPTQESLFSYAEQVETKNLKTDRPVSLWKKSINDILLLDKEWQSGRYTYKAVYHGGQKFSAEIDLDNDGYFEIHEYYRNGNLHEITYNPNRKSTPEFTLKLDPYPVLSWDFNQDGLIDEVERKVSSTTTLLEFSTKMDGVFDVITKEVSK